MGVISLFYTISGGLEAVIWTDVMQVVVLAGGAIFSLIWIGTSLEGGFGEIVSTGIEERKRPSVPGKVRSRKPGNTNTSIRPQSC